MHKVWQHVAIAIVAFSLGYVARFSEGVPISAVKAETSSARNLMVDVTEVRQQLVRAEKFSESFHRTVKLVDGTERTISITPDARPGSKMFVLNDTGEITYMFPGGATTNRSLMVQVWDLDLSKKQIMGNE